MEKTEKVEKSKEPLAKIINKIRELRKQKGYSSEIMAMDLDISTSAYNKMERMEASISLERFIRICEILDIPYSEFYVYTSKDVYKQDLKDSFVWHYEAQKLYQENKEIYEKLIAAKDEQIAFLKSLLEKK